MTTKILTILLIVLLVGCAQPQVPVSPGKPIGGSGKDLSEPIAIEGLQKFESSKELADYLRENQPQLFRGRHRSETRRRTHPNINPV